MQSVPAGNVLDPTAGFIVWLVAVFVLMAAAAAVVRLIVRAVRALEKRSTVAEEVLLLSARLAQQERDLAELRSQVQRLSAPARHTRSETLGQ
jgi:hypothetical protein